MVYLTPRFLVLAALVATAAMPSFVLQTDARAIGLVERHHDKSSHLTHSPSSLSSKGKGEVQERPTIPLPPSAKGRTGDSAKAKKHRKGGRKHQDREMFVPRSDEWVHFNHSIQIGNISIDEGTGQSFSNTRRLLDDVPQREESQATFSLHKRGISRIYGKRERKIEEMERQEMLNAARAKAAYHGDTWDQFDPHLKVGKYVIGNGRSVKISEAHNLSPRSPEPHHHHGHHHHQDKVIVNGDHDDVRIHERRTSYSGGPGHHELVTNKLGAGGEFEGATPVGRVNEPRSPHHHHHHHHHHDNHDEVVVNGDDDKVRVHERREPHHHHHHHHHGEHKTVINGDNDNVHIHSRGTNVPIDADCGDASQQRKRSDAPDNTSPGVPGTIDIMTADGPVRQKLASLIMSSVENSASGSTPLNGTKATSDVDSGASPFILDASNSTQTQFFLVASSQPAAPAPSVSSSPLANTLSVLKAAASSKNDDSELRDVSVMLQVLVFEPKEAAMRSYCATYDPSPPAPAPLYMNRCFSDKASDPESAGKMTESSLHKSQIFAYNPITGTVRPRWISVTGGDAGDSSEPELTSLNNATSSTSDREERQMDFKIPSSNKYAPQHMAGQESPLNETQTLNETVASVPSPSSLPETPDPQNVTLVFTPSAPAVHVVSGLSSAAAFKPATDTSGSDSSSDSTSDEDADDGDASSSSSTTASLDSASETTSDSATTSTIDPGPSDMPAEKVDATSDTTDSYDGVTVTASASSFTGTDTDTSAESTSASVSDPSSSSEESAVVPTDLPTYIIDEAAIEKMYQEPRLT